MNIIRFIKDWTLPLAMSVGAVVYLPFAFTPQLDAAGVAMAPFFAAILPLFMFLVLFVTFCKVDFRQLRPVKWHWWVGVFQLLFIGILMGLMLGFHMTGDSLILMEAILMCIISPCATAAAVVTQKLGGSLEQMTTYTFLSNFLTALLVPVCFPMIEKGADITFMAAFMKILREVVLVLVVPMLLAYIVKHHLKRLHQTIISIRDLSYYLWACSLMIVTGTTVKNIVHAEATFWLLTVIALIGLIVCVAQFAVGRFIGHYFDHTQEAGQALGQKNTAFAIWLSSVYLNPLSSVGPGCYILWQNIVNSVEIWQYRKLAIKVVATACLLSILSPIYALPNDSIAKGNVAVYTEERPLVYEDAWDLWPYAFLNDKGEPEGFNIDLIRMMMKELNIPYVIKLRPTQEAFNDLRDGKSDLMLGVEAPVHDQYGRYSKNAVTLFTQSAALPKNRTHNIAYFRDLRTQQVIVLRGSLCHNLMQIYGWDENAIPVDDIREAIQEVSAKENGQIVWNTLSLKWLMNRYHIENLDLVPVNMSHGDYKFMSNNQRLLDLLDETYTKLYTAEKLTPIQIKWFYPERQQTEIPEWAWVLVSIIGILILVMLIYIVSYRLQARRVTTQNNRLNKRLALIMETSQVRMWTYNVNTQQFSWHNENGQVAYIYTLEEFSRRYTPEGFQQLMQALQQLSDADSNEDREQSMTLNVKARDTEDGDAEMRDFLIRLSVLRRDKNGHPSVIIGTKKDITEAHEQQRLNDERRMRYWALFNTPVVGIMFFNREGVLVNINSAACDMLHCVRDKIIGQQVTIDDVRKKMKDNELRLIPVDDDMGNQLGVFAVCRDITSHMQRYEKQQQQQQHIAKVKSMLNEYNTNIDRVLSESDVRLAVYSPLSHTLTIYRAVGEIQHALTQTRCMTLVDDYSKKVAMRMLNDMDEGVDKDIVVRVRTTLRVKDGRRLSLQFNLMPQYDKQGHVVEYLGLCRDISELRTIERRIDSEMTKVQEVENTKNSFVKNMVQEIRTPMSTVVNHVAQLPPDAPAPNEAELSAGILHNADYLLHLIDNILYLSRLEAHMVEINRQPHNFAETFESQCMEGWTRYRNSATRYIVESPYEQLVVDIDAENLGHAIAQITSNAAQHTHSGVVRARYDYIGRRLMIVVDDTGEGIPKAELARLQDPSKSGANNTKGLGLAICRELVSQMDGTLEISSEEGSGTTVYITIPCHATVIKRKKLT